MDFQQTTRIVRDGFKLGMTIAIFGFIIFLFTRFLTKRRP